LLAVGVCDSSSRTSFCTSWLPLADDFPIAQDEQFFVNKEAMRINLKRTHRRKSCKNTRRKTSITKTPKEDMQLIFDGSGSSCYWDFAPGFDLLLALLVDDGHILCRSILTAAHHLRILPLIYFSLLALLAGLPMLALMPYVLTKLAALYSIKAAYYSCYYTCSRAFYSTIYLRAAYAGMQAASAPPTQLGVLSACHGADGGAADGRV
jgi:hypothetical protein